MSTAQLVRDHLERLPECFFVFSRELQVPPHAVDCELVRLVTRNELRRVRQGIVLEGAIIEMLRDRPLFAEADWNPTLATFARPAADGKMRLPAIAEPIRDEHHVGARTRWRQLEEPLQE